VLPLAKQIGDFGADTVKFRNYIDTAPVPPKDAAHIALIIARGTIEEPSAAERPGSIAPQHLVRQLADAIKNPSIKAILLRLDTPGGTVTGSAMVGAEVAAAAAAHKPLIVSMGELDASGGYWISSHGAMLVADPATLTGSIGVLSGKLSFAPLLRHVGVTITGSSRGDNANFDSAVKAWTPTQLASVKVMLNHDYRRFVAWVASGRHMTPAAVEAVAQGRVWTGVQAKRRGLVDENGGYHTALLAIRAALHLKPDAPLAINVARLSLKDLLQDELLRKFAGNNPLGLADLPPELRVAARAAQLHRLEMFPLVLR
jgi:protease-4